MSAKRTKETSKESNDASNTTEYEETKCGYIMPIAEVDGYESGHWVEVKNILNQVLLNIGFKENNVSIVSEDEDVGTIHKRIVNNIYHSDIVICDLSSRNPNVMFELGMRIAFDKPLIIIKDDCTDYCFDSGTIEHINYPKSLRFSKIEEFKIMLSRKIIGTIKKARENPDESPILKSFGSFDVSKKDIPEMSAYEEMSSDIQDLKTMVRRLSFDKKTDSYGDFVDFDKNSIINKRRSITRMLIDLNNEKYSFEEIMNVATKIDSFQYMGRLNKAGNIVEVVFNNPDE